MAEQQEPPRVRPFMDHRAGLTDAQFIRRSLILIGILALVALAWVLREILLMVFGAIVIATLFRALAGQFERLRLPEGLALFAAVLTVFAIVGTAAVLFGAQLVSQAESLTQAVPAAWKAVQEQLGSLGLPPELFQLGSGTAGLTANAGNFAMSLGSGLADALLIVVGGIFIAASPKFYRIGAIKLVPEQRRGQIWQALEASGNALRLWLKAQLLTMAVIGVVTGLGLWLIGVPSALALALLAALLEFIPYVGPIVAAIPAILLAMAVDPQTALLTVGLYVIIQQLEGYVLSPLIQQWAVDLPGALLLFSLLACGTLFGALGVIFAAPLTVVIYVLVKKLYVQEALDTNTPIPGEDNGKDAATA